ncbi:MAG: AmmeMemoRadiSam system radical SAM enzyme [Rubripirellula sp.]
MSNSQLPIISSANDESSARWWTEDSDDRILCTLCPRACRLKSGDRGFCFVRTNRDGRMVLDTYGRSTGFCIDPIEKKPLNHFLPGTPVLSFGTAGCNLGCKFCQNWDISKSREVAKLSNNATPNDIALAAKNSGCRSVAFTYNDPVIWAEYALDTATACRDLDIKTVAVTAGYITDEARGEFFDGMDAANIDLKAFTEEFYFKTTGAHLDPILDTIRFVVNETDCWVELTNLIIPDANDDPDELKRMCDWLLKEVGDEVPIHFTAFHPDFKMLDRPRTPHDSLVMAYDLAREAGLRYVYVGNVHDVARQSTYCPSCNQLLIERNWHELGRYALNKNRCQHCDFQIAGHFEPVPGSWGQKRQPIRINSEPTTKQDQGATMQTPPRVNDSFTQEELTVIHRAACEVVTGAVQNQPGSIGASLGELAGKTVSGIYVTLKRGETLRGCCGLQGPLVPLARALADAGVRTAKHDPRMSPIAAMELPYLTLSVSILGPPRPIDASGDDRIEAVQIGKHGLRISMAGKVGLLLPVVAEERQWNSRQFLDAVCNKAGLPPGSWRSDDAELLIFDGVEFGAPFITTEGLPADSGVYDSSELLQLKSWVRHNLVAVQTGATPFYYATGTDDATVQGVVLQVTCDPAQPPFSWMQLNLRDGFPLQSTLFQMTQTAAQSLALVGPATSWDSNVAVLTTPVHHGTDQHSDLQGLNCQQRALITLDGKHWAIGFDHSKTPEELLKDTLSTQAFRSEATQVHSVVCDSIETRFEVSMGPQAREDVCARPAAVAGTFYPADDLERDQAVDSFLSNDVKKQKVNAAMVPHAGLRFSGQIAADVWSQIELPETVLIIGPKHTSAGVDWAVAPHDAWQLSPTTQMTGDIDLARHIVANVPGMQLDANAHAQEHGIEIQLPLLHRIAPQTRVTAIAMSGGTHEELREAAEALAKCLAELEKPPLLVISSDMNHFADDVENRRRDRIALDVLKADKPENLRQVCADENISMCGQIPATLALLTLKAMKQQAKYQEIGYATSADVTGDSARVVGYAGILF